MEVENYNLSVLDLKACSVAFFLDNWRMAQ